MSALLVALKVLGWILLGLLALLLLVCLAPVSVFVRYEAGELTIYARVYGIKIKLLPGLAAKEEEKAAAQGKTEDKAKEKVKQLTLSTVRGYLSPGTRAAVYFFAHVRVSDVCVVLAPLCDDPMHTAFKAGREWAELGALAALAENTFKEVVIDEMRVVPVFFGEYEPREKFCCKLSALAGIMIGTLIVFLKRRAEFSGDKAPVQDNAKEN